MVHASGAHSTDLESPESVESLTGKCETPAKNWAPVADELWACSGHCAGCKGNCWPDQKNAMNDSSAKGSCPFRAFL